MPAGMKKIPGGLFRLFTSNDGNKTTSACVVTAHASQAIVTPHFRTPRGFTVHFYSEQGAPLRSRSVQKNPDKKGGWALDVATYLIGQNRLDPVGDPVGGDQRCPNYVLDKLHLSTTGFMGGHPTNWLLERFDYEDQHIINYLEEHPQSIDLVTVRHRPGKIAATLEDAVEAVTRLGYSELHAACCRSPYFGTARPPRKVKLANANNNNNNNAGGGGGNVI